MASRKRKVAGDKEIERLDRVSPVKITRREVAVREINQAIRLRFQNGDVVVIHLLAAAARDVIAPVVRAAGKKTLSDDLEACVRPEYVRSWRDVQKEPFNFFKHGGANPDEELAFFDPDINDMTLFEACCDYRTAFDTYSEEMVIFLAWHFVSYPNLLNEHGAVMRAKLEKAFEGLDERRRLERAQELIAALDAGLLG